MIHLNHPRRAAIGAIVLLALPATSQGSENVIGFRFPDWPVSTLVDVVDDNRGLRDLLALDRDMALRGIERLIMPHVYVPGDETACPPAPPPGGRVIPIEAEGERICAVAQVVGALRLNPALGDMLQADPALAGLLLELFFEPPIEDRQAPVPVVPSDPEVAAVLEANPALDQMYQTSPEAVLSIIEMLRLAAAAE